MGAPAALAAMNHVLSSVRIPQASIDVCLLFPTCRKAAKSIIMIRPFTVSSGLGT